MEWQNLLAIVGVPLVRCITGWLNNALIDGVIEKFEWKKLLESSVNILVPGLAAFFGISLMGLDVPLLAPLIASAVIDWIGNFFAKKIRS